MGSDSRNYFLCPQRIKSISSEIFLPDNKFCSNLGENLPSKKSCVYLVFCSDKYVLIKRKSCSELRTVSGLLDQDLVHQGKYLEEIAYCPLVTREGNTVVT